MTRRARERILENLDVIYREAYDRAKKANDETRMLDLDASYQREQLILEVLLDVRDALLALSDSAASKTGIEKLEALKRLTRFK